MKNNNIKNMCVVFSFVLALTFGGHINQGFSTSVAYAEEHGGDGDGDGAHFEYLELNPLVLPVINERGLVQQISLVISLELAEGLLAADLEKYQPRLADAFIQDLYGVLGSGYGLTRHNILDVHLIKTRLTAVTESVVGPDKVENVLLQVVQQRRL